MSALARIGAVQNQDEIADFLRDACSDRKGKPKCVKLLLAHMTSAGADVISERAWAPQKDVIAFENAVLQTAANFESKAKAQAEGATDIERFRIIAEKSGDMVFDTRTYVIYPRVAVQGLSGESVVESERAKQVEHFANLMVEKCMDQLQQNYANAMAFNQMLIEERARWMAQQIEQDRTRIQYLAATEAALSRKLERDLKIEQEAEKGMAMRKAMGWLEQIVPPVLDQFAGPGASPSTGVGKLGVGLAKTFMSLSPDQRVQLANLLTPEQLSDLQQTVGAEDAAPTVTQVPPEGEGGG